MDNDRTGIAGYDDAAPVDDNIGFVIPASGGLGDMLANKLLALRPLGIVEYEAEGYGTREATECYVLEIPTDPGSAKGYIDLGRQPIPWEQPRNELRKANDEAPWVLGTLVKRTKAWFLNPPRPQDVMIARNGLREWVSDRRAATGRQATPADYPYSRTQQRRAPARPTDEEPF